MRAAAVRSLAGHTATLVAIVGSVVAPSAAAQVAPRADTIRVIGPVPRALLDSIDGLLRQLERQPTDIPMRAQLESMVQRLGDRQVITLRAQVQSMPEIAPREPRMYIDGKLVPSSELSAIRAAQPKGWIGITFAPVPHNEVLTDDGDILSYFDYPSVMSIDPDSPAEGAGIKRGDVLVEYDGRDIRGRPLNVTQMLQPDRRVSFTMRRDGELKSFTMTVAKAPVGFLRRRVELDDNVAAAVAAGRARGRVGVAPMPDEDLPAMAGGSRSTAIFIGPRLMLMNPDGMFGARLTTVTPELASALHLRIGVLATDVPESAPAYKAGLRTGDVIVAINGDAVKTLAQVRHTVAPHVADRSVTLDVFRGKKSRKITVRW